MRLSEAQPGSLPDASPAIDSCNALERMDLQALRAQVLAKEEASDITRAGPDLRVPLGLQGVDEAIGGGLAIGAVHEWLGLSEPEATSWLPPITLLHHVLKRVLMPRDASGENSRGLPTGLLVWIGERCRPYPPATARWLGAAAASRCVFVRAGSVDERVWAMDLALRSEAVAAVIADAHGVRMPESRRLQLAAAGTRESGTRPIALLVRPAQEQSELSAARTRWLVSPRVSESVSWTLELLRCKGVRPIGEEARQWAVQMNHETGDVRVVAAARDSGTEAARAAERALVRRIG
jgi:hypothetical protein